jgi:multiple sugar transport system substrate-binding protein
MAESVAKYVVVDMFAKACAGASTKEVIKNAEAQLKEIYKSA